MGVGLTSPALPYLLAVVCVLLLIGVLFAWPRLAGRGLARIALRVVSLCLLQASVLSLIFVTVNRSGEFYSSWADLFGSDSGGGSVLASHGNSVRSQSQLIVTGRAVVRLPGSRKLADGTLESITIHGQLSGLGTTGDVYLPAGYQPADKVRHYPVILVISNALAGSQSPYGANRLAQSAATEIAAHRLQPVIMVMVPPALAGGDQACLNVPAAFPPGRAGTAAIEGETFFAQDLPAVVESAYRASSLPANWALLADDSGGYCALQLAMDNSYVFATAVAPRGDYSAPPGAGFALSSTPLRSQDDLIWQLSHLPMQPVSVLFAGPGSVSGPGLAQSFISLAQPPMRVAITSLATGSWPLGRVLDWIGAAMTAHARTGNIR